MKRFFNITKKVDFVNCPFCKKDIYPFNYSNKSQYFRCECEKLSFSAPYPSMTARLVSLAGYKIDYSVYNNSCFIVTPNNANLKLNKDILFDLDQDLDRQIRLFLTFS